jgi:hypothetical protein
MVLLSLFSFICSLFQRKCHKQLRHYNNSEYFGIGSGRIALSDYVMNGYNILAINLQYIVSFKLLYCVY